MSDHPFRVLIVDDNEINRLVLAAICDTFGIAYQAVADGRASVEAVTVEGGYDAVLMDIQMPVMDGFEATRLIRAWETETGQRRLPIYFVSANCLDEHVKMSSAAGGDGHLAKPFSVPQLMGLLEPHVRAAA